MGFSHLIQELLAVFPKRKKKTGPSKIEFLRYENILISRIALSSNT